MPQHIENITRSTFRPARQSGYVVPYENAAAVRMRETSARNRMGGQLHSRSHQRYFHAIDIVSAVSPMSPLFLAKYGFVQREIAGGIRECGQTSVASVAHYVHKHQMFGGIINPPDAREVDPRRRNFCLASHTMYTSSPNPSRLNSRFHFQMSLSERNRTASYKTLCIITAYF